jgi:hypothetical protein
MWDVFEPIKQWLPRHEKATEQEVNGVRSFVDRAMDVDVASFQAEAEKDVNK